MPAMQKVPDDHPLMIAWEKYKVTEEAASADKWARTIRLSELLQGEVIVSHPYLEGSLWAAFVAGFKAAGGAIPT